MADNRITRHSITGSDIADLWRKHAPRYEGSLGRITDARLLLSGQMQAPLPEVIAKRSDAQAFRVDTAQKYTSTMQLVNKLADPEPVLVRSKTGSSDLSERNASRIEKFINPATRKVLSNRDLVELLLVEGETAALVIPEAARFQKAVAAYYSDDKAETISEDYRTDEQGRSYRDVLDEADTDEDLERAKAEFKPDEKRSRAAYDRHIRNLRARNYPFDVELLSRQQMVPLNPRIKGADVTVDGLLIKTRLTASEAIRRKYVIPGLTAHTEPKSSDEGDTDTGDLWLYQYVGSDIDDEGEMHPYFAYSLMGQPTKIDRAGFDDDAVIDLRKTCGMTSLPVAYGYGWRWFSVDPDQRAMPYSFPFGRSWLAQDALLTGKTFAAWSEGFLAWFMRMPDTVKDPAMQQAWMEFVAANPLVIEAFKVLPVWGDMVPAVHPGTGRDVNEMIAALGGSNAAEVVNPLARGGGDAASAIERSVVSADTVLGVSDIRKTNLAMTARVGELILEVCSGISRLHSHDVLVYGNPERPTDQTSEGQSPTRAIIELKAHWLGPKDQESFDLIAEYPERLGDKLAEKAQLFGFYKEHAITFEDWCTAIGVQDPDRYRAQLIYDQWIMSPEGIKVAMRDAAQYSGDQELVDMFKAEEMGAAGPGGAPMGALAGMSPPTGPLALGPGTSDPGAQAMTNVQDPAASQYAAIAGAARSASAGGVGPTPQVMGV
jgi:hypothetical protein